MAKGSKNIRWTDVKAGLERYDLRRLLALVRDLYDASADNRRFVHARVLGSETELEKYRALILDAVYPDLLGRKRVRIGEAQRLVRHFRQATGDTSGTVDLMLTLVEAGTDLAADTGHGDEAYFESLEKTLAAAVEALTTLPADEQVSGGKRLASIVSRAASIGWGYCDAVREIAASYGCRSGQRNMPAV